MRLMRMWLMRRVSVCVLTKSNNKNFSHFFELNVSLVMVMAMIPKIVIAGRTLNLSAFFWVMSRVAGVPRGDRAKVCSKSRLQIPVSSGRKFPQ